MATGILWACHGGGPDPSRVGQRVSLKMGARVVHEYGVVQEYGVVHENEWCTSRSGARDWCTSTSGARDGCTRVHSGARAVHEYEWCTSGA